MKSVWSFGRNGLLSLLLLITVVGCGGAGAPGVCVDSTSCTGGATCIDGTCQGGQKKVTCSEDKDCDTGQTCTDGTCQGGQTKEGTCSESQVCTDGKACVSGTCITCKADKDCGDNKLCEAEKCIDGNCRKAGDCKNAGEVCKDNTCIQCSDDKDCEKGQICEQQKCRAGCRKNTDCQNKQACDPKSLLCKGCLTNKDCVAGLVCQQNTCAPCSEDKQCTAGQLCLNKICTIAECKDNTGCQDNKVCRKNKCEDCLTHQECGTSFICVNKRCKKGECQDVKDCLRLEKQGNICKENRCVKCSDDKECGPGRLCISGLCKAGNCRTNSDCAGLVCLNNLCTPCKVDTDCGTGSRCVAGACKGGECQTSADCNKLGKTGQLCVNSQCTPCTDDKSCGTGNLCVNGACTPGNCRAAADCDKIGKVGQLCIKNQCTPCKDPADDTACGTGKLCLSAVCKTGNCRTKSDCDKIGKTGQVCVSNQCAPCKDKVDDKACGTGNICVSAVCKKGDCHDNTDCTNGQVCLNNQCSACQKDQDCSTGFVCLSGVCKQGCNNTSQCTGGLICDTAKKTCVKCTTSSQCASGQVCDQGLCKKGDCLKNSDCQNGQVCIQLTCSPCTTNQQCGAGNFCRSGSCLISPALSNGAKRWGNGGYGKTCTAYRFPPKGYVPALESGSYWIKPQTNKPAFKAYCDMTSDGGGWTLLARYTGDQELLGFDSDKHQQQTAKTGKPNLSSPPDLNDTKFFGHIAYSWFDVLDNDVKLQCRRHPTDGWFSHTRSDVFKDWKIGYKTAGGDGTWGVIGRYGEYGRAYHYICGTRASNNFSSGIAYCKGSGGQVAGWESHLVSFSFYHQSTAHKGPRIGCNLRGPHGGNDAKEGNKIYPVQGRAWIRINAGRGAVLHQGAYRWSDGYGKGSYAKNCTAYRFPTSQERIPATKDGVYWIKPNASTSPFKVVCDMTTDGGGWTLVGKYNNYSTIFGFDVAKHQSGNGNNLSTPPDLSKEVYGHVAYTMFPAKDSEVKMRCQHTPHTRATLPWFSVIRSDLFTDWKPGDKGTYGDKRGWGALGLVGSHGRTNHFLCGTKIDSSVKTGYPGIAVCRGTGGVNSWSNHLISFSFPAFYHPKTKNAAIGCNGQGVSSGQNGRVFGEIWIREKGPQSVSLHQGAYRWTDGTYAKSCTEYRFPKFGKQPTGRNGLYWVVPAANKSPVKVYCYMTLEDGGWTEFLQCKRGDECAVGNDTLYNVNWLSKDYGSYSATKSYSAGGTLRPQIETSRQFMVQVHDEKKDIEGHIIYPLDKDRLKFFELTTSSKYESPFGLATVIDELGNRTLQNLAYCYTTASAQRTRSYVGAVGLKFLGKTTGQPFAKTDPNCDWGAWESQINLRLPKFSLTASWGLTQVDKWSKQDHSHRLFVRNPSAQLALHEEAWRYAHGHYAKSCKQYRLTTEGKSGLYWIQPRPLEPPIQGYCDMSLHGGGWLLVFNMVKPTTPTQTAIATFRSVLSGRSEMKDPVVPTYNESRIRTHKLPLETYYEAIYGWALTPSAAVSRYGVYSKTTGLAKECILESNCADKSLIGTFLIMPQGITRALQTGQSTRAYTFHVGIGWGAQQILWGYDGDSSTHGSWGNWNLTTCCKAGNNADSAKSGWRYGIYIR